MRSFQVVRQTILAKLLEFFTQRMNVDAGLLKALGPHLNPGDGYSRERIRYCHLIIAADCDPREFSAAYKEFVRTESFKGMLLDQILKKALERPEWKPIATAIARVLAAAPHSCDVERLISVYNRFKTDDRSSFSPETINDYLHVWISMHVLSEWNPWDAVKLWISEKERRQIKTAPQMESECFVGVFREAGDRVESLVPSQKRVKC